MTDAATDVAAMMERDLASAALGMVVERDEPGHAVVSMRVRDDMTNGFHITHGGLVFALADTAFAIACNEDDAHHRRRGRRHHVPEVDHDRSDPHRDRRAPRPERTAGLYDVTVTDESGDVVAEVRGPLPHNGSHTPAALTVTPRRAPSPRGSARRTVATSSSSWLRSTASQRTSPYSSVSRGVICFAVSSTRIVSPGETGRDEPQVLETRSWRAPDRAPDRRTARPPTTRAGTRARPARGRTGSRRPPPRPCARRRCRR